jgi:hypothetical protein
LEAKSTFGWFRLTHQFWKWQLFLVLGLIGAIGLWSSIFLIPSWRWMLMFSAWVILVWIWLMVTVKCPACGMRVAYRIYARTPYRDLYMRFRNMQACPGCGKG